MEYSVEEVTAKLAALKARGFVPSKRRGATGVGHTLEQELELTENNFVVPDLGEVELKATRSGNKNLITLFTVDRNAWKVPQKKLIRDHGIDVHEDERTNLYVTLRCGRRLRGLITEATSDRLLLRDSDDQIVASWPFDLLLVQFHRKIRHLILVSAESRTMNQREHFHYKKAIFHSGWLLRWHIPRLFNEGIIHLDIRMHVKDDRVRNHGTAFRIMERDLPQLYPYGEELPI